MDGDRGESNFGHRPSICRQGIATQGLCNLFCLGKNCLAFGELDKVEGRTDLKIEIQENFLVTKQLFMSSYYGQFGLSVLNAIGNLSFFFGLHIFENCDLLWSII